MEIDKPLTAADGAEFHATIEEMPEGLWRASGVVRLDAEPEVRRQAYGVEMLSGEEAARTWADRAAMARGFLSFKLEVKRQPKPMS
jgi:hypothetical protein